MVRGLIEMDALGGEIERGDEETRAALAEIALAEGIDQRPAQRGGGVFGAEEADQPGADSAALEDLAAGVAVELQELLWRSCRGRGRGR